MKAEDLYKLIDKMLPDIEFEYKGVSGAICPFSHTNVSVSYGDMERTFDSLDALMNAPFIEGKPLKDICDQIDIGNY